MWGASCPLEVKGCLFPIPWWCLPEVVRLPGSVLEEVLCVVEHLGLIQQPGDRLLDEYKPAVDMEWEGEAVLGLQVQLELPFVEDPWGDIVTVQGQAA